MVAEIMQAVLAPFYEQVGVQGVAYGLLGFKTIRKLIDFGREYSNPKSKNSEE